LNDAVSVEFTSRPSKRDGVTSDQDLSHIFLQFYIIDPIQVVQYASRVLCRSCRFALAAINVTLSVYTVSSCRVVISQVHVR